ncbi:hypothetical protein VNO77_34281 [Canavalia gladiata]|uniref:Uncharacterized protein n=1 Tax=Canavalia gladiata TaxID=3824 RepID=A0AAN9KFZ1_CANGL
MHGCDESEKVSRSRGRATNAGQADVTNNRSVDTTTGTAHEMVDKGHTLNCNKASSETTILEKRLSDSVALKQDIVQKMVSSKYFKSRLEAELSAANSTWTSFPFAAFMEIQDKTSNREPSNVFPSPERFRESFDP